MGEFPSKKDQIKPGEVRNPKGSPGHGVTYYLKKLLKEHGINEQTTHAEQIAKKIIELAEKGGMWPANIVMDRTEGKVSQPIQVEPIDINVTYTDKDET
jgi:hypothetical protein